MGSDAPVILPPGGQRDLERRSASAKAVDNVPDIGAERRAGRRVQ